ncbi:ATP-binding protein [Streptomyces luteogriseus]|uniref:ATP-binding protein n=1 Tax=Streptomyces luteogriseus TaxID=68233 RepID=UPI003690EE6C
MPGEYLVRTGYAVGGGDGCIAHARHRAAAFVDQAAHDHHLSVSAHERYLTQLVVTELVTNARKYAPGPVLMELRITVSSVDVVVWDSDPSIPTARAADPRRIGGHGLEIVKAAAEGFEIQREQAGKRITARIALTSTSGGAPTAPRADHHHLA